MSAVGQREKRTRRRVVKLFREQLGYDGLGDWTERAGNRNIDESSWMSVTATPSSRFISSKRPDKCLEYIVVHELAHLIARHHNDCFVALMDQHLPHWRRYRQALDAAPLAHADWIY